LFNKTHFLSIINKLTYTHTHTHTNPNVTAVTVPVTLDDKQQYLIVHAILMALTEIIGEEELVNVTGNRGN
jgi:hypothetical protein